MQIEIVKREKTNHNCDNELGIDGRGQGRVEKIRFSSLFGKTRKPEAYNLDLPIRLKQVICGCYS